MRTLSRPGLFSLFLLSITSTGLTAGPVFPFSDTTQNLSFPYGLFLRQDPSGKMTLPQLLREAARYPFTESRSPVPVAGQAVHWVRFAVANTHSQTLPALLEIDYPYLDDLRVYQVAGGTTREVLPPVNWQTPLGKRLYPHRSFVVPVMLNSRQTSVFYLRMYRRSGTFRIPVRLWQPEAFRHADLLETAFWGLVAGWLLFAVAFAMALFFINGGTLHLFYSLYTFFQLGGLLTHEGLLSDYYLAGQLGIRGLFVRSLCTLLIAGSNILFIRSFLRSHYYASTWLTRFSNSLIIAIGCWIVVLVLENVFPVKHVVYFLYAPFMVHYLLLVLMSVLYIGYALYQPAYKRMAWLYLAALSPILLIAGGYVWSHLTWMANLSYLQMHVYAGGVVFETVVLMFGLAYRFRTFRDEREQLLKTKNETEHQTHLLALKSQQQERARLARDLHDGIGLELSVFKMRLSAAADQLPPNGLLNESLLDLDRIASELRTISHALMPSSLQESGLVSSLEEMVRHLTAVNPGLEINFIPGEANIPPLPPPLQQSVYQITKELLNNTLKHAGASLVDIELYAINQVLHLTVADNGKGYDPETVRKVTGLGLRNIQSSIVQMEGQFAVIRRPGGGMVHQITIPVH